MVKETWLYIVFICIRYELLFLENGCLKNQLNGIVLVLVLKELLYMANEVKIVFEISLFKCFHIRVYILWEIQVGPLVLMGLCGIFLNKFKKMVFCIGFAVNWNYICGSIVVLENLYLRI